MKHILRAFLGGLILGVVFVYLGFQFVFAASSYLAPDADGTVGGARTNCTGATANYECVNNATGTSTAPSGNSHVLFDDGEEDYYEVAEVSGVDTVSAVFAPVYHRETNGNEAVWVSLWDATENTQYGSEVEITNRTTAQWDDADFTGLSLTQGQLNGLKVRVRCLRPGGGSKGDCEVYAVYPVAVYTESIDVTVGSTSAQQDLDRGTTTAHVGGAFTIVENTSSRTITDITITENGSVNGSTNLDNIQLRYDLDTDFPYNCESESYSSSDAQFGSTDTDGFSSANGTSTFTQTVSPPSISTTQSMCVYVVLDVGSGAGIGETIEIEIDDPSTEVDGSGSPTVRPVTSILLGGTTTILDDELTQESYHWRQDNGDQTDNAILGADSFTSGNSSSSIDSASKDTHYRLRLAVSNEGNATSSATQYRIEYAEKGASCAAVSEPNWYDVDASADAWDMVNSTFISDGNTTNITTAGKGAIEDYNTTFDGTGALRETTSLSGSITLESDEFTELEYSMNASSTIVDGTTYCFRVTDNGTPLPVYTKYPEITFNADVTVSEEEAQPSTVSIPTTNQLMGAFTLSSTTGATPDIDSITIRASSTGDDVTADFDNIELYWEYDTSAPANCASESFSGFPFPTETQYGTTDTDGFTSGSGTSTFSQAILPPQPNTTRAVCVYVVLDVTSSADDGDLLDIGISDPSVDIVLSAGSVAPTSLVELSGITTLTSPYIQQGNYHWRDNDSDEANASSLTGGTQNTILDEFAKNTTARIRFDISNTGGEATGNMQYRLEWAQKLSSCDLASGWEDVDTAADEFTMVASQLVDNASTSDIAVGIGGVTNLGSNFTYNTQAQKESSSQTNNLDLAADSFAEIEYSIQATTNATEGASYCFRLTDAGTVLDNYVTYPEVTIKFATDFVITRGVSTIGSGSTTATINAGNQYSLQLSSSSRAFARITNVANTGAGSANTVNNNASNVTAFVNNPGNITTNITFERQGTTDTSRISWEIVEYVGATGGDNEITVRSHGVAAYTAGGSTVSTGVISPISDDADVVPWITGQGNEDGGRFQYHTGVSTATWNAGSDTATFTRGDTAAIVNVSYAIVEFLGPNWTIQRSEHTYTSAGSLESDTTINPVGSLTKAFLHVQKRIGSGEDQHADFGHEVYMNSVGAVRYLLDGNAQTPSLHTSVAWIIENTQNTGSVMHVERSNGTIPSGAAPQVANPDIGKTLDDLTIASLFANGRADGTGRSFQEPIFSARLLNSSTTQYELWVGDPTDNITYRVEVVEWPTASAKLFQNDYWWYEDNDLITPTTPWSGLGENQQMLGSDDPIAAGESIRLRMSIRVTAAAQPAGVVAFNLEYAEKPDGTACSAVSESEWKLLGDISSSTALFRGQGGTPVDGTTLPSTLLSESTVTGTYEEEVNTAVTPVNALVNDVIEFDWNIEHNVAKDKANYCFRMQYGDGSPLEDVDNYPVIRTEGYGPEVGDWKWFDDETSLTPSTDLAATNSAPTDIADNNVIKLRTVVSEKSGAAGVDMKFKVQFSESSDFSGQVFDVVSSTTCAQQATTTSNVWCYDDGAGVDNATVDDNTLATADSCTGGSGNGCGSHNEGTASSTATIDQPALSNMEFEFTLRNDGARANAVYYFRLWNMIDEEVVPASSTNPSLVVEGPQLSFTLSGVPSGTNSEGVTSDVSTTATTIPFGSVPFDTEYEAIYRLNVDTSATEGYQLLMYATQLLLNTYGESIPLVTGTNASPNAWTTGCSGTESGCFGYHVGDDVLDGGSTRFAADDTYARISTSTPEEVAHSPVSTDDTIDMVFKLQVTDQQPAGEYAAEIVYLVIPVF